MRSGPSIRCLGRLESKGIDSARITVEGRGEREPLAAGDMGYARALNRRVEMFLREPTN